MFRGSLMVIALKKWLSTWLRGRVDGKREEVKNKSVAEDKNFFPAELK